MAVVGSLLAGALINRFVLPPPYIISSRYAVPILIAAMHWPPRALVPVTVAALAAYGADAARDARPVDVWPVTLGALFASCRSRIAPTSGDGGPGVHPVGPGHGQPAGADRRPAPRAERRAAGKPDRGGPEPPHQGGFHRHHERERRGQRRSGGRPVDHPAPHGPGRLVVRRPRDCARQPVPGDVRSRPARLRLLMAARQRVGYGSPFPGPGGLEVGGRGLALGVLLLVSSLSFTLLRLNLTFSTGESGRGHAMPAR